MAKLIAGGGEPVNDGERLVLDGLVTQLADEVRIIPNWTVVHPERLDECDAIVVTRDAVFIVETKHLVGDVEIGENDFFVDGSRRTHPYHLTHQKAQRLRTKLNQALPWFEQRGRVEAQVILAVRPRALEIDDLMKDRVIGIPAIGATLDAPSKRVFPQQRGRLEGRIDEVVNTIIGGGRVRERDKYAVDDYRIDEVIFEQPEAGYFRAIATNLLTSIQQVLDVYWPLPGLPPAQLPAWRLTKAAPVRAAQKIGPHGSLLSPTGIFDRDDGSIVIVSPMLGEISLKVDLDNGTAFTTDEARSISGDIASALAHVHAAGFRHGSVDPLHCATRPKARGVLRFGETVTAEPAGQRDDLAALGLLTGVLAQRSGDAEIAEIAAALNDPRGPQLTAAEVATRLAGGGVIVVDGGDPSIEEMFTDLQPLTSDGEVTVYAGTDLGGARVAIKLLGGADASSPETWREYRVLKDLNHPSVVRTLGAGQSAEGPFMITELLEGVSLSKVVNRSTEMTKTEKVSMAVQLLSALKSIHPDAERIAELMRSGDPEDEAKADELRAKGVVHNDICPENIRWIPERGAVLFDFDLAGRIDSYIGQLNKPYRPGDLPADVAVPDADVYAVGAVLHELLCGMLPYEFDGNEVRVVRIDEKIDESLREVLTIACAATANERFPSADAFLDALLAAGVEITGGAGDDMLERIRRIDDLVRQGEFDEALELCDEGWVRLRATIEQKRSALDAGGAPLMVVDGVELRRRGHSQVGPVQSAKRVTHEVAEAEVYAAVFPDGGVLEFAMLWANHEGKVDLWMAGLDEIHTHPRIARLVRGLRPGSEIVTEEPLRVALRLYLAVPGKDNPDHAARRESVTVEEMNDAAGFDVSSALSDAGAVAFDTFEKVAGGTGKHRTNLCVVFDPFASGGGDIAAIAYFASRVMALFRTI